MINSVEQIGKKKIFEKIYKCAKAIKKELKQLKSKKKL